MVILIALLFYTTWHKRFFELSILNRFLPLLSLVAFLTLMRKFLFLFKPQYLDALFFILAQNTPIFDLAAHEGARVLSL